MSALAASSTDAPPAAFSVELPQFSGPLELLLTLIRDEQLDVYDIPIARVAEQFVQRIRSLGLNEAAEYLEMAARLLRIKAQMLLPRPEGDEALEDPRAELVRRLLEYQQVREVVDVLERRSEDRRGRFARAYVPSAPAPVQAPLALSLAELLSAVDRVLRAVRRPVMHEIVSRPLDVAGAMSVIRALVRLRARALWSEIVELDAPPWQVLSALLGLLELVKLGELRMQQAPQILRGGRKPTVKPAHGRPRSFGFSRSTAVPPHRSSTTRCRSSNSWMARSRRCFGRTLAGPYCDTRFSETGWGSCPISHWRRR
jgi:segregation and condensation protein A